MAKPTNIFASFMGHETLTAKVEALDNAEIKYRTLTMAESDAFQKRTVKEFDSDGKPTFNFDELSEIKYDKIALCLVEPKMTKEQLKDLGANASKALGEIDNLISGVKDEDLVDEEGK